MRGSTKCGPYNADVVDVREMLGGITTFGYGPGSTTFRYPG